MAYKDITRNDRNPIKRWLQRKRISDATSIARGVRFCDGCRILDFGAGDGELVNQLVGVVPASIDAWVYEPIPSLMAEARENLSGFDGVTFVDSLCSLASASFDYVFCLEVFEHLPDKEMLIAIAEIRRVLKPDGLTIIGVPHELFLAAFLKGIFRMSRRYGDFDALPCNIVAAILGRPPSSRPVTEIAPGFQYHFHHLGFDFRTLEKKLQGFFEVTHKKFSPFPPLGAVLNSEVYLLLRKLQSNLD